MMRYLAEEAKLQPSMHVLFLTPCHATPYYSHVHSNITMDFLDCSPPGEQCIDLPSLQIMPKIAWVTLSRSSLSPVHLGGLS